MLSRDEFVDVINTYRTTEVIAGEWEYRLERSRFTNRRSAQIITLSFIRKIAKDPSGQSFTGYVNQKGILKTDKARRFAGSFQ